MADSETQRRTIVICPNCQEVRSIVGRTIQPFDGKGQFMMAEVGLPLEENLCGTCLYWMDILTMNLDRSVRVDGFHYTISDNRGPFHPPNYWVKFFDASKSVLMGLWSNAIIPEWAREYLPDNAEWEKLPNANQTE